MLMSLELLMTCAVQGIAHYTWTLVVREAPRYLVSNAVQLSFFDHEL
jgi:hypothetical protein